MRYVVISKENWIQKVHPKLKVPKGLFTDSAKTIADFLCKNSISLKQAMSRINFYVNRSGNKDKKFEIVKELIRKYFEKN